MTRPALEAAAEQLRCGWKIDDADHPARRLQTEALTCAPGVPLGGKIGRDDRIRTCDPLTPSQVRYQAALHPELEL